MVQPTNAVTHSTECLISMAFFEVTLFLWRQTIHTDFLGLFFSNITKLWC